MTRNPLKGGRISENSFGLDTVNPKLVMGRAAELATIRGDWLHKVSAADFERVRQQSAGEADMTAPDQENITIMSTPIIPRDLSTQAPHSPRERLAGFAIATRAVDKCRASLAGTLGEYRYDCPLDNTLFSFKGITGEQFKAAVQASSNYEEVGAWLQANGTPKTPAQIKAWSDEVEAASPMKDPEKRSSYIQSCSQLGLNPQMNSTFDWLEADDRESFRRKSRQHEKPRL